MSLLFYYFFIKKNHLKSIATSILFPKNEWKRISNIFLLCLVVVLPLICSPILLFFYRQILVLIANSEVSKQILIQFIFLFVLLICLLDMLALVIISVIGWLYLLLLR